jgi:hypothetical protein
MLTLRPHHLLDIVTQYGSGAPFKPHVYGHAVHTVAETVLANIEVRIRFVTGADDICAPCRNLKSGRCVDVLAQLDPPLSKQDYNDGLDRRLFAYFGMTEGQVLTFREYLAIVQGHLDGIERICTHPKEDPDRRLANLTRGLAKLGAAQRPTNTLAGTINEGDKR